MIDQAIESIADGFGFLGFRFYTGRKLRPSRQSLDRLRTRARRLHEREGTGTAFGSTWCVGTGAAWTDSSAGEEAPDAPGITCVRTASQRLAVTASIISRGSIRQDECAVGGRLYECAPHGVPYERSQMETNRESGTGPVRLVLAQKEVRNEETRILEELPSLPEVIPIVPRSTASTRCGLGSWGVPVIYVTRDVLGVAGGMRVSE